MSMLDGLLQNLPVGADSIGEIAEKLGMDPAMVEKGVAALGQSHGEDGDTMAAAAEKTGMDSGALSGIMDQLGGEGGLGQVSEMLNSEEGIMGKISGFLDQDGDGNPINDIMGMAGKLFGKN